MKKTPVISLKKVNKVYPLQLGRFSLSGQLLFKKTKHFSALKNISFQIFSGERVGLVGPNGSGKTTLLRIISGATLQDSGSVIVRGKIVSLIELGVGFHQEITGRSNIFINGLILGMNKDEISTKLQSIIDFADIGNFIDEPMYSYSQGMKLRLAFAIAVHSQPDILLLDEAIGVGDEQFRKKCDLMIHRMSERGVTIIVVTHWVELLRRYCQKIIWIEKGKLMKIGGLEMLNPSEDKVRIKKFQKYQSKKVK